MRPGPSIPATYIFTKLKNVLKTRSQGKQGRNSKANETAPAKQQVDEESLEGQVKEMYRRVADDPHGKFNFEYSGG